ncbi:MAG: 16S rRNA (cytosine(967)-C(5))-methyltransferase RsmB [Deltaproteobacteria bacterium]|nr:16S rRNA (cytosine(967)-C(5))-methyltransferase RsmB [Deltaproteobacteria bacterium]
MARTTPDGRVVAIEALRKVDQERAFAASLLRFDLNALGSADRGLATELVYGVLRRRAHLDAAIEWAAKRRLKDIDPRLHPVLRVGIYQLMFLDRIPARAAVHTTVEIAKRYGGVRCGGFVNAVLRRIADADPETRTPPPPPFDTDAIGHLCAIGSVSRVVAKLLLDALGPVDALAFLHASLLPTPLTLRANLLKVDRDTLANDVQGTPGHHPAAIRLPGSLGSLPSDLSCVADGRATPQDEAAMAVVELLDPQPGESILDVCAAPGGKTTHTAERMRDQGRIVATDRHPERLARVEAARVRLGLTAIEVTPVMPERHAKFDRVLVDAPCSGLGTLRRHPEIRWRLAFEDVEALAKTQAAILAEAATHVRPGGILVYAVCTVTKAENEAQLEALDGDFERLEAFVSGPHQPGAPDGFFAAKLRRIR